jgi:hypothetical protein
MAVQDADRVEKQENRKLTIEYELEIIPDFPEAPATSEQRKRTYTLVERTPDKLPSLMRLTPGLMSRESSPEAPSAPPPSTAQHVYPREAES